MYGRETKHYGVFEFFSTWFFFLIYFLFLGFYIGTWLNEHVWEMKCLGGHAFASVDGRKRIYILVIEFS